MDRWELKLPVVLPVTHPTTSPLLMSTDKPHVAALCGGPHVLRLTLHTRGRARADRVTNRPQAAEQLIECLR
ncbi:hypothetical protein GCM10010399_17440 [Dactylosporangium fulvum]